MKLTLLSRIVTARCDIALFVQQANVKYTKVLSNRTCSHFSILRTCGKLNKEILRIIFQIVMDLN